MSISEKINAAKAYVAKLEGIQEARSLQNDAANIFADSYEEYMAIWCALQKGDQNGKQKTNPGRTD